MIRRLTALLLSSLVLQLNFRPADLLCARHGGETTSKAEMTSSDHHGMTAVHHGQQGASEQKSCEIPATRDCCLALTSCTMTLGLGVNSGGGASQRGHRLTSTLMADAPASSIPAPAPPPPKLSALSQQAQS